MEIDREHIVTCTDCRKFYKEMIAEDRDDLKEDFRTIVKEEWQNSVNTIERVTRIEKLQSWIIVGQFAQGLGTIYLIYKILIK